MVRLMVLFQFVPLAMIILASFLMGNVEETKNAVDFLCSQSSVLVPIKEIQFHSSPVFTSTSLVVEMIAPAECELSVRALDLSGRMSSVFLVKSDIASRRGGSYSLTEAMAILQMDMNNITLPSLEDAKCDNGDVKEIDLTIYSLRISFLPSMAGDHQAILCITGGNDWNHTITSRSSVKTYPIRGTAIISPYLSRSDYNNMVTPIILETTTITAPVTNNDDGVIIDDPPMKESPRVTREIFLSLEKAVSFLLPEGDQHDHVVEQRGTASVQLMDLRSESAIAEFLLPLPDICLSRSSLIASDSINNQRVNNKNKKKKRKNTCSHRKNNDINNNYDHFKDNQCNEEDEVKEDNIDNEESDEEQAEMLTEKDDIDVELPSLAAEAGRDCVLVYQLRSDLPEGTHFESLSIHTNYHSLWLPVTIIMQRPQFLLSHTSIDFGTCTQADIIHDHGRSLRLYASMTSEENEINFVLPGPGLTLRKLLVMIERKESLKFPYSSNGRQLGTELGMLRFSCAEASRLLPRSEHHEGRSVQGRVEIITNLRSIFIPWTAKLPPLLELAEDEGYVRLGQGSRSMMITGMQVKVPRFELFFVPLPHPHHPDWRLPVNAVLKEIYPSTLPLPSECHGSSNTNRDDSDSEDDEVADHDSRASSSSSDERGCYVIMSGGCPFQLTPKIVDDISATADNSKSSRLQLSARDSLFLPLTHQPHSYLNQRKQFQQQQQQSSSLRLQLARGMDRCVIDVFYCHNHSLALHAPIHFQLPPKLQLIQSSIPVIDEHTAGYVHNGMSEDRIVLKPQRVLGKDPSKLVFALANRGGSSLFPSPSLTISPDDDLDLDRYLIKGPMRLCLFGSVPIGGKNESRLVQAIFNQALHGDASSSSSTININSNNSSKRRRVDKNSRFCQVRALPRHLIQVKSGSGNYPENWKQEERSNTNFGEISRMRVKAGTITVWSLQWLLWPNQAAAASSLVDHRHSSSNRNSYHNMSAIRSLGRGLRQRMDNNKKDKIYYDDHRIEVGISLLFGQYQRVIFTFTYKPIAFPLPYDKQQQLQRLLSYDRLLLTAVREDSGSNCYEEYNVSDKHESPMAAMTTVPVAKDMMAAHAAVLSTAAGFAPKLNLYWCIFDEYSPFFARNGHDPHPCLAYFHRKQLAFILGRQYGKSSSNDHHTIPVLKVDVPLPCSQIADLKIVIEANEAKASWRFPLLAISPIQFTAINLTVNGRIHEGCEAKTRLFLADGRHEDFAEGKKGGLSLWRRASSLLGRLGMGYLNESLIAAKDDYGMLSDQASGQLSQPEQDEDDGGDDSLLNGPIERWLKDASAVAGNDLSTMIGAHEILRKVYFKQLLPPFGGVPLPAMTMKINCDGLFSRFYDFSSWFSSIVAILPEWPQGYQLPLSLEPQRSHRLFLRVKNLYDHEIRVAFFERIEPLPMIVVDATEEESVKVKRSFDALPYRYGLEQVEGEERIRRAMPYLKENALLLGAVLQNTPNLNDNQADILHQQQLQQQRYYGQPLPSPVSPKDKLEPLPDLGRTLYRLPPHSTRLIGPVELFVGQQDSSLTVYLVDSLGGSVPLDLMVSISKPSLELNAARLMTGISVSAPLSFAHVNSKSDASYCSYSSSPAHANETLFPTVSRLLMRCHRPAKLRRDMTWLTLNFINRGPAVTVRYLLLNGKILCGGSWMINKQETMTTKNKPSSSSASSSASSSSLSWMEYLFGTGGFFDFYRLMRQPEACSMLPLRLENDSIFTLPLQIPHLPLFQSLSGAGLTIALADEIVLGDPPLFQAVLVMDMIETMSDITIKHSNESNSHGHGQQQQQQYQSAGIKYYGGLFESGFSGHNSSWISIICLLCMIPVYFFMICCCTIDSKSDMIIDHGVDLFSLESLLSSFDNNDNKTETERSVDRGDYRSKSQKKRDSRRQAFEASSNRRLTLLAPPRPPPRLLPNATNVSQTTSRSSNFSNHHMMGLSGLLLQDVLPLPEAKERFQRQRQQLLEKYSSFSPYPPVVASNSAAADISGPLTIDTTTIVAIEDSSNMMMNSAGSSYNSQDSPAAQQQQRPSSHPLLTPNSEKEIAAITSSSNHVMSEKKKTSVATNALGPPSGDKKKAVTNSINNNNSNSKPAIFEQKRSGGKVTTASTKDSNKFKLTSDMKESLPMKEDKKSEVSSSKGPVMQSAPPVSVIVETAMKDNKTIYSKSITAEGALIPSSLQQPLEQSTSVIANNKPGTLTKQSSPRPQKMSALTTIVAAVPAEAAVPPAPPSPSKNTAATAQLTAIVAAGKKEKGPAGVVSGPKKQQQHKEEKALANEKLQSSLPIATPVVVDQQESKIAPKLPVAEEDKQPLALLRLRPELMQSDQQATTASLSSLFNSVMSMSDQRQQQQSSSIPLHQQQQQAALQKTNSGKPAVVPPPPGLAMSLPVSAMSNATAASSTATATAAAPKLPSLPAQWPNNSIAASNNWCSMSNSSSFLPSSSAVSMGLSANINSYGFFSSFEQTDSEFFRAFNDHSSMNNPTANNNSSLFRADINSNSGAEWGGSSSLFGGGSSASYSLDNNIIASNSYQQPRHQPFPSMISASSPIFASQSRQSNSAALSLFEDEPDPWALFDRTLLDEDDDFDDAAGLVTIGAAGSISPMKLTNTLQRQQSLQQHWPLNSSNRFDELDGLLGADDDDDSTDGRSISAPASPVRPCPTNFSSLNLNDRWANMNSNRFSTASRLQQLPSHLSQQQAAAPSREFLGSCSFFDMPPKRHLAMNDPLFLQLEDDDDETDKVDM